MQLVTNCFVTGLQWIVSDQTHALSIMILVCIILQITYNTCILNFNYHIYLSLFLINQATFIWLVVWNMNFIFPFHIWDVIPTPLTNSYSSRWFLHHQAVIVDIPSGNVTQLLKIAIEIVDLLGQSYMDTLILQSFGLMF